MHSAALIQEQVLEANREKEHAIRLAKIAGVASPEERVEPELTATIRFGDPNLAALFQQKARNDLNEESLAKLEASETRLDTSDAPITSLEEVEGITPDVASNLRAIGYHSPEDLKEASDEELLAVDGIGQARLEKIREDLG